MVNLGAIFLGLRVSGLQGSGTVDRDCPENHAGLTFFRLVLTDLLVVISTAIPAKALVYWLPPTDEFPLSLLRTGKKASFDLPKEVMDLVYRHAHLAPAGHVAIYCSL